MSAPAESLAARAEAGDASAQYEYACERYARDADKSVSFRFFQKAALNNHAEALYQCGRMCESGEGVPSSVSKAQTFYERAEQRGSVEASLRLGELFLSRGASESSDRERSLESFRRAGARGSAEAQFHLGQFAEHGWVSPPDEDMALRHYELGASLGSLSCSRALGLLLFRRGEWLRSSELLYRCVGRGDAESEYFFGLLLLREEEKKEEKEEEESGREVSLSRFEGESGWSHVEEAMRLGSLPALLKVGVRECTEAGEDQERRERGLELLCRALPLESAEVHYQYGHHLLETFPHSVESQEEAARHLRQSVESSHHMAALRELGVLLCKRLGRPEEGEPLLCQASSEGDGVSSLEYGVLIYHGESSSEKDQSRARSLFRQAAESGLVQGCLNYSIMCLRGEGGAVDYESACSFLERAVASGSVEAQYSLALLLEEGVLGPPDLKRALSLLESGASVGDPTSQYHLGRLRERDGEERDLCAAREWYHRCAEGGCVEGMHAYARMCLRGEGGDASLSEAEEFLTRGFVVGDSACTYSLARLYERSGDPVRVSEAHDLYQGLSAREHAKGSYRYGRMLESGTGGDRDLVGALECYEKAGEQGHAESLYRAARIYREVNPWSDATQEMFRRACDLGHGDALYEYGVLLLQSPSESASHGRSYLLQALDRGVSSSLLALGVAYEEGLGGSADARKAREFYRQSSESGSARGSFCFGLMLLEGRGGALDVASGWQELKRAALELGSEDAALKLLELSSSGRGGVLMETELSSLHALMGESVPMPPSSTSSMVSSSSPSSLWSWCAIA